MSSNRWTSRPRVTETGTFVPQSRTARVFQRARSLATGKHDYVLDLAADSDSGLVKLAQRRKWLLAAFVFGLIATAVVWIAALRFPYAVSAIYSNGVDTNLPRYGTLLSVLLMSIPFAPPFISVFALSNLLFPTAQPELTSGVMSTFQYTQKSNRRYIIFIAAGMFGALNCLLLLFAVSDATGN